MHLLLKPAGMVVALLALWAAPVAAAPAEPTRQPAPGAPGTADTEATEQLVYYPLVTDGIEYRRVMYPEQVDTIGILADTNVVLDARRSMVAFWPITREYLADFRQMDEPVEATVELVGADGERQLIEPSRYTVWYPDGVPAGQAEVITGERGQERYDTYVQEARAAAEELKSYQEKIARHQAAVDEWLDQAAEGVDPLPDPPEEFTEEAPEQYVSYSSEIDTAPVLNLPAGRYTVRLLDDDGQPLPGSERTIESFAPLEKAIGYYLLPEERWTQPVVNFSPQESLYVTGTGDVFLRPIVVEQYNAYRYARLFEPQTVQASDPARRIWVPQEPLENSAETQIALRRSGEVVGNVPEQAYRVQQERGTQRGYTIETFDADNTPLEPDFRGMRLPTGGETLSEVVLLDADGSAVTNSRRSVRFVNPPPEALLYLPALLPLLLYFGLRWRGQRRRKAARRSVTREEHVGAPESLVSASGP